MERTDQPTPPHDPRTLAAQILTTAAGLLHQDAISPITLWNLDDALTAADAQVLTDKIPSPDRTAAREQSRSVLPPTVGTCAQYAEQLRAKARAL